MLCCHLLWIIAGQLEFASKQLVAAVQANTGGMAGQSGLLLPLDQMASAFWSESSAGELAQGTAEAAAGG
jgi:hypothetical protein